MVWPICSYECRCVCVLLRGHRSSNLPAGNVEGRAAIWVLEIFGTEQSDHNIPGHLQKTGGNGQVGVIILNLSQTGMNHYGWYPYSWIWLLKVKCPHCKTWSSTYVICILYTQIGMFYRHSYLWLMYVHVDFDPDRWPWFQIKWAKKQQMVLGTLLNFW